MILTLLTAFCSIAIGICLGIMFQSALFSAALKEAFKNDSEDISDAKK